MTIVHLILTIITGGVWLPVWIVCILLGSRKASKEAAEYQKKTYKALQRQNELLAAKVNG